MNIQPLALAFMAATAVGGVAWVFIYPMISGEKQAESRRASFSKHEPAVRQNDRALRSRREQVEGSMKEQEAKRKKKKSLPLNIRLTQAGVDWTTQKFMIVLRRSRPCGVRRRDDPGRLDPPGHRPRLRSRLWSAALASELYEEAP